MHDPRRDASPSRDTDGGDPLPDTLPAEPLHTHPSAPARQRDDDATVDTSTDDTTAGEPLDPRADADDDSVPLSMLEDSDPGSWVLVDPDSSPGHRPSATTVFTLEPRDPSSEDGFELHQRPAQPPLPPDGSSDLAATPEPSDESNRSGGNRPPTELPFGPPAANSTIPAHSSDARQPTLGYDSAEKRQIRGPESEPIRAEQRADAVVPGYEIQGELGRGGMGVVYRARQIALNRTVALKMILAGAHASSDQRSRFQAEAESVAQLLHPNIVQVFDVGEINGLPYIAFEFVPGHSLAATINRNPLPVARAIQLSEKLARAVQFAHAHGIIHRDLKPANILLTPEGEPKITDFGLAKRLEAGSSRTRTGAVMGTPSYMAPEQARADRVVGIPADVYALGAILYELLTGRPPFTSPTTVETVQMVIQDEPIPPTRLVHSLPRDLETICLKCLEKEPQKRYASAAEFADELQRVVNHEPIRARRVSLIERGWRWCRRNTHVAALSAAVAMLFIAATVLLSLSAIRAARDRETLVQVRLTATDRLQQARDEIRLGHHRQALALLGAENPVLATNPQLDSLHQQFQHLRLQVQRYDQFQRWLDELHFVGLFANRDQERARELASQLIGLYDEIEHSAGQPGGGLPPLDDNHRQMFYEDVFEAFLIAGIIEWEAAGGQSETARRNAAQQAVEWLTRAEELIPPTRHLYVRRGFFYQQLGKTEQADADFHRSKQIEPSSTVDVYWRGYANLRRAELTTQSAEQKKVYYLQAMRNYSQVLRMNPEHFWAYYNWATCQFQLQQFDNSVIGFTACIHLNPEVPWPHYNRGLAHLKLKNLPESIEDSTRAIELDPAYTLAYFNRSQAYQSAGEHDRAISDLNRVLQLDPEQTAALVQRASLLKATGNVDDKQQAIRDLTRAIDLGTKSAQLFFDRAILRDEIGESAQAITDITSVIEGLPRNPLPLRARGLIYLRSLKNHDAALRDFQALVALRPKSAEPHYLVGIIHLGRRQFDEATRSFESAIEFDPQHEESQWALAQTLLWKRQPEKAVDLINRFYAEQTELSDRARMVRGELRRMTGDLSGAAEDFQQIIDSDDADVRTLLNAASSLARILAHTDRADEAERLFDRMVREHAERIEPLQARAVFLRDRGRLDEADADCALALKLQPDDTLTYVIRASILARSGQENAALNLLKHSLKPDRPLDGRITYLAASTYSLASAVADEGSELHRSYADKAAEFLQLTLDTGFHDLLYGDHNRMVSDPSLEPVRNHPRVQALLSHLL